jgi:arsenite-transporting ATPase
MTAIAERGTVLDRDDVDLLLGLTPPGIDELGGLLELARLARTTPSEIVVVDTAPTAHTLSLVAIPELLGRLADVFAALESKADVLAAHFGRRAGASPGAEAVASLARQAGDLQDLLRDRRRTAFTWVSLAEDLSVAESADGLGALAEAGIEVSALVINRVLGPGSSRARRCESCRARRRAEVGAIASLRAMNGLPPLRYLPELAVEPRGVAALTKVERLLEAPNGGARYAGALREASPRSTRSTRDVPEPSERAEGSVFERWRGARLLLFGGKGGVGKTTCAATAALELADARPRETVLLVSTDPAHSLGDVLAAPASDEPRRIPHGPPNLWVRELDSRAAFEGWLASAGADAETVLDGLTGEVRFGDAPRGGGVGSHLLEWLPAGLDELIGILSLLDALFGPGVSEGPPPKRRRRVSSSLPPDRYDRVVVDTAPTGHALRLLAMPEVALEWDHALMSLLLKYREVVSPGRFGSELLDLAARLKRLIALLREPEASRFVVVARPAHLVVAETSRLVATLAEMGIAVREVIANAVVAPRCATCRPQSEGQKTSLEALGSVGRKRGRSAGCDIIFAPASFAPPRGLANLRIWSHAWSLRAPSESSP